MGCNSSRQTREQRTELDKIVSMYIDNYNRTEETMLDYDISRPIPEPQTSYGDSENTSPQIQDVQTDDEKKSCVICMTNEMKMVVVPCGHYCMCFGCSSKIMTCPMCRGIVDMVVPLYHTK